MVAFFVKSSIFFMLIVSSAYSSNISLSLNKKSYTEGERAKITVIIKTEVTNQDFDYIVVGKTIGEETHEITFNKLGNIFIGTTGQLKNNGFTSNVLRLNLKLQNTARIFELNSFVTSIQNEIDILMARNTPADIVLIEELKKKNEAYQKELSKQTVLVEKINKIIPVDAQFCDFESFDTIGLKETVKLESSEFSTEDFTNLKSHFFEKDGHKYEVRFANSSKNRKIGKMPRSSNNIVDYCTEEYETELSDDMLPSWSSGRNTGKEIYSEYTSSVRCFKDDEPLKCKFKVFLSKGPCDGRHSTFHNGVRPLGRFTNLTENRTYDIPATSVGRTYKFIAPDISGDVVMNFLITFPDGKVVQSEYTLRVFLPGLIDISDTSGISEYLIWDIASHANLGTYGTFGFGDAIKLALKEYVDEAISKGIPNDINKFSPLSSGGVSLQFGGLLDIDFNWKTPHKRHRQGVDMDIGMTKLSRHTHGNELKEILDKKLRLRGFIFDIEDESYVNQNVNHWHIRFPYGGIVDSNGGR